jgi:hypothetical protein
MLTALIVGALTAWFLGLRFGLIAAGISFAALVVAKIVPGMTITVYVVIIGWCALLYFFGAKIRTQGKPTMAGSAMRATAGTVGSWVAKAKKMFGSGGS